MVLSLALASETPCLAAPSMALMWHVEGGETGLSTQWFLNPTLVNKLPCYFHSHFFNMVATGVGSIIFPKGQNQ